MAIDNINNINKKINWKELTAKEIIKYKDNGSDVPEVYQSWAAAISAAINVKDDVTYEMTNGSTDISALEEEFGTRLSRQEVKPEDETGNNFEENPENKENENQVLLLGDESKFQPEKDEITLADQKLLTDPNEIIKRKIRKGEQSTQ